MPPSGFNTKAINGLLTFLEACYQDLLKQINSGVEDKQAIKKELDNIREYLSKFKL